MRRARIFVPRLQIDSFHRQDFAVRGSRHKVIIIVAVAIGDRVAALENLRSVCIDPDPGVQIHRTALSLNGRLGIAVFTRDLLKLRPELLPAGLGHGQVFCVQEEQGGRCVRPPLILRIEFESVNGLRLVSILQ